MKRIHPLGALSLWIACLSLVAPRYVWSQVELQATGTDHISININGQPFSDFYIGSAYPKPFLAPLRSATGLIVTRNYPMETVEGESRDHPHHRGLWIGYGNVNGVNFWENEIKIANTDPETPKEQGRIALRRVDRLSPGKKSGTIGATFAWRDSRGKELIEERRFMTFYADPDIRTVDIDATFSATTNVQFADTKEGFFAIRVADSMAGKNGGIMTNSEGEQTETNVWGRRADWVDYDGTVAGQKVGIAIFDDPRSYNHPPRWHCRDYGLFAVNPFGLKDFKPKAAGKGGRLLAEGQSMHFRYRVVVHAGDVPKKEIADWYTEYCKKLK